MFPKKETRIPLYSAGGELQERITEHQASFLHANGLLLHLVRHRKGHINRAILRPRLSDGAILTLRSLAGTKYSYKERLPSGKQAWALMPWAELAQHEIALRGVDA